MQRHPGAAGAFLALAAFSVYAGSLKNIFVFDDESQIIDNPFILNPHLWTKLFSGSVWSFVSAAQSDFFYRPLQMFYYWLIYRCVGANASVFHLVQLLVYVATGWIVYRLGCEILANECAAMLGAALWILHPLHVEAVAYISGMADAGAGLFYLLGFLLFVRAEKLTAPAGEVLSPALTEKTRVEDNSDKGPVSAVHQRRSSTHLAPHLVAAAAYFPALFFKEMAMSFPLLVVAYWFFCSPRGSTPVLRRWSERMFRLMPYIAAVAAYVAVRLAVLGAFARTTKLGRAPIRIAMSAFALLGQHARLLLWPVHLSPYRTFYLGASLRSPWPYLTVLALAAAFWYRRRDPQLSFLVAWWAVALVPCLDIRQLSGRRWRTGFPTFRLSARAWRYR